MLNFLIVGAPKSATTAVYSLLRQHSMVRIPSVKEPNFLALRHSRPDLAMPEKKYLEFFRPDDDLIRGEASVCYLSFHRQVVNELLNLRWFPKVIIILREPASRAFSHHEYYVARGLERADHACITDRWHRVKNDPWGSDFNPYLQCSLYAEGVSEFRKHFDTLVLDYETINCLENLRTLHEFIGIEAETRLLEERNVGGRLEHPLLKRMMENEFFMNRVVRYLPDSVKSPIKKRLVRKRECPHELEARLRHLFSADVSLLEASLGRRFERWGYS